MEDEDEDETEEVRATGGCYIVFQIESGMQPVTGVEGRAIGRAADALLRGSLAAKTDAGSRSVAYVLYVCP